MEKDLSEMRKNYGKAALGKKDVHADPFVQFARWFDQAKDSNHEEANVMHVSTVTEDGQPEGRIVLLKSFNEKGFTFFTHYQSDKGRAIQNNNKVALTFYWPMHERQVRIQGTASVITASESDEYFYTRPEGSQISAVVSPQSQVIENYAVLEQATEKLKSQGQIKRPKDWGGYCVVPDAMEFWQGRPNRLHDRIKYTKSQDKWLIKRLAP